MVPRHPKPRLSLAGRFEGKSLAGEIGFRKIESVELGLELLVKVCSGSLNGSSPVSVIPGSRSWVPDPRMEACCVESGPSGSEDFPAVFFGFEEAYEGENTVTDGTPDLVMRTGTRCENCVGVGDHFILDDLDERKHLLKGVVEILIYIECWSTDRQCQ